MHSATSGVSPAGDIPRNSVYERIKARVIAHDLPTGKRILIEPLADQLFVSSTPVREALIRLSAEQVIQGVPKSGFFIKEVSETEIRDLYALQQLLLDWSLSTVRNDGRMPGMLKPPNLTAEIEEKKDLSPHTVASVTDALFLHIARQSGNADVIRIVSNINDRTHYASSKDFAAFAKEENAILCLCQAYYRKDFDNLRKHIKTYFHRKTKRLPDLLRLLRGSFIKNSA